MRNLELLCHRTVQTPFLGVKSVRLDSIKGENCHFLLRDSLATLNTAQDLEIAEHSIQFLPNLDSIVDFEYLALNDEYCLVDKTNGLFLFNPHINPDSSDCVASFPSEIAASKWSPEQEVLVVVTTDLKCYALNSVFDIISEVQLSDSQFGEESFMNVGWGKKETQFHGSEGKGAAMQAVVTGVEIKDNFSEEIGICWRGDGEYFVVSFTLNGNRLFKVFDKEGTLKFTSEKSFGLDRALAWKPSGLWIAIPQLLADDKYVVALFERNGLRHRELELPFKRQDELVKSISWSSDSEVLMVETLRKADNLSFIYLFIINNYHWYLKQILQFGTAITNVSWSPIPSEGKMLKVILADGNYEMYKFDYSVASSNGCTTEDESVVAVIDGKDLLLTNFRSCVIPPPMFGYKINCRDFVNAIGFIQNPSVEENSNMFWVRTRDNLVTTFKCQFEQKNNLPTKKLIGVEKLEEIAILSELSNQFEFHHLVWVSDNIFVASNKTKLILFSTTSILDEFDYVDSNIHNVVHSGKDSLIIGLLNGDVFKIKIGENLKFSNSTEIFHLPTVCDKFISFADTNFCLKSKEMLYLNGDKFLPDITSMYLIGSYLAVTTIDELKFVNLLNKNSISERKIERGGLLVTIVSQDSRTVLQLPRGNLETLKPRTLSLNILSNLLENCEYAKSYDILRRERINLNLLVDHNPEKFYHNMEEFYRQIENPNWLNLFITELQNEDVTTTIYKQNYPNRSTSNPKSAINKVDFICSRFCEIISDKFTNEERFLLPKITSYVKRKNIEKALDIIWHLKQNELKSGQGDKGTSADDALQYLLYLVDVNDLYSVALGMYDFDLVLFVAKKSQKDPKEYLPFLNELNQFEENYRKYKIDLHLRRYEKSLQNVVNCGQEKFVECLNLIKDHNLYSLALNLVPKSDCRYSEIAINYGDYLRGKGKLMEASLMYEKGNDLEQALNCARNSLSWERCLKIKEKLNGNGEEFKNYAIGLIPAMMEKGLFLEASEICRNILQDSKQTLEVLFKGKLFTNAIYNSKTEEEYNIILKELLNHQETLFANLKEDDETFFTQKSRLLQIRTEKQNKLLNDEETLDLDSDLYSDTTSLNNSQITSSSRGTSKTFRSSKNRRKHERKLLNLKEGNVFEDIALIDALHNLTIKIFNHQNHVRDINLALIEMDLNTHGQKIQKYYRDILYRVKMSFDEIWIPEMIVSDQINISEEFDLKHVQENQRYSLIKMHQRFKPQVNVTDWEFDVLK